MMNLQSLPRRRQLATGVTLMGCALAAVSQSNAAIQSLDLGPSGFNVLGVNAGISSNYRTVSNFPVAGPYMDLFAYPSGGPKGLAGSSVSNARLEFAVSAFAEASPRNFANGATIDSEKSFTRNKNYSCFYYDGLSAANFNAGSFMGFRFSTDSGANWNYGWLEVTWDGTDWEILSGAYESTVGGAILAGATGGGGGGGVPLPGAAGLAACGLLGLSRQRRR